MTNYKQIDVCGCSNYPTTSDISLFMRSIGYDWSNQAQVYFYNFPCKCIPMHNNPQTIDRTTAEHIYKSLYGNNPYDHH